MFSDNYNEAEYIMQKKYDNYCQSIPLETRDSCSEGIHAVNTTLSSIQEILVLYLKKLAFYIYRLNKFGVNNLHANKIIIYTLYSIVTDTAFRQDEFNEVIAELYDTIESTKNVYIKTCTELDIKPEYVKSYFKMSRNFTISEAIRKGERYSQKKAEAYTTEQKDFFDIMMTLLKSLSIREIELHRLGTACHDCFYGIISLLNAMNFKEFSIEKAKEDIFNGIKVYYDMTLLLHQTHRELYGEVEPTDVSFSTKPGKAILVSGSDYKKLDDILNATKDLGIDVYSHGIEMLMSHSFKHFKKYPNYHGHYGFGIEASSLDFSTFPGSIIMTKSTIQRIDLLYRGRLFTLDPMAPMGVVKLNEGNLSPLVESAKLAKGFSRGQDRPSVKVGFNEKFVENKIQEICQKIKNKEIRHLFIIGLINFPVANRDYFDKFFDLLPDDCYAISLSCPYEGENIFHLKSFYDYSLFEKILCDLEKFSPLDKLPLSVYTTRCDKHTISHLLYLSYKKIKNIYACKCSDNIIKPSIKQSMQKFYNIKVVSDAETDLKNILKE
jgi:hydroxylamine reductase